MPKVVCIGVGKNEGKVQDKHSWIADYKSSGAANPWQATFTETGLFWCLNCGKTKGKKNVR